MSEVYTAHDHEWYMCNGVIIVRALARYATIADHFSRILQNIYFID